MGGPSGNCAHSISVYDNDVCLGFLRLFVYVHVCMKVHLCVCVFGGRVVEIPYDLLLTFGLLHCL